MAAQTEHSPSGPQRKSKKGKDSNSHVSQMYYLQVVFIRIQWNLDLKLIVKVEFKAISQFSRITLLSSLLFFPLSLLSSSLIFMQNQSNISLADGKLTIIYPFKVSLPFWLLWVKLSMKCISKIIC